MERGVDTSTSFFDNWNFDDIPKSNFFHSKVDHHNLHGYRGDNFEGFEDGKKYLITIGDSWTFCSGIYREVDTWPYHLSQKLGCYKYYNLAIGGRSIDYVARILYLFLNKYKPKGKIYLACIFPSTLRTEFFTDKGTYVSNIRNISELTELGGIGKLVSLTAYKNVFKNAYTNIDKFLRNYLLIEYICNYHQIEFAWSNWYMFFKTAINDDSKINNFYYKFCFENNFIHCNLCNNCFENHERHLICKKCNICYPYTKSVIFANRRYDYVLNKHIHCDICDKIKKYSMIKYKYYCDNCNYDF